MLLPNVNKPITRSLSRSYTSSNEGFAVPFTVQTDFSLLTTDRFPRNGKKLKDGNEINRLLAMRNSADSAESLENQLNLVEF